MHAGADTAQLPVTLQVKEKLVELPDGRIFALQKLADLPESELEKSLAAPEAESAQNLETLVNKNRAMHKAGARPNFPISKLQAFFNGIKPTIQSYMKAGFNEETYAFIESVSNDQIGQIVG